MAVPGENTNKFCAQISFHSLYIQVNHLGISKIPRDTKVLLGLLQMWKLPSSYSKIFTV
jgi:hypothetical protein